MKVSSEFSKYATQYGQKNVIQEKVAKKLLSYVKSQPRYILDLGCGGGAICKRIDWKYRHFTGVDFAAGMLELHPKSENIEAIYGNFNDNMLFEYLSTYSYDYIVSASALQWSEDLEMTFRNIKSLEAPIALAIFTSNTFKTLHDTASIKSLLKSSNEIIELQKSVFDVAYEVVQYKLEFESTRDMFRYIKQSGVSGSRQVLSYRETKKLLDEYPLSYLEFEVVFIYSR